MGEREHGFLSIVSINSTNNQLKMLLYERSVNIKLERCLHLEFISV